MTELSEILHNTITNYPTCPVAHLIQELTKNKPDELGEQQIIELLASIKRHENELKEFRKMLEKEFLNYQVESILSEKK